MTRPEPATREIERGRAVVAAAARIVSFSGAGLSAESGVATFRDAATGGAWTKHDPARLASPEGFAADPVLVLDWYAHRRRIAGGAEPNAGHRALAGRPEILHVTQNVDDLLERAGASEVVHLHGTLDRDRCHAGCGYEEPVSLIDPPAHGDRPRRCPACGGSLRPSVVWFGEALPDAAWSRAHRACAACDLLLVVGTSAVVHPAAGLIGLARGAGARVIVVNPQRSEASALADVELTAPAGEALPPLLA